jgi:hypothetical protein
MPQPNDLSRSLAALEQDSTLIVVIEMSLSSWLVAGIVPGIVIQRRSSSRKKQRFSNCSGVGPTKRPRRAV